VDAPQFCFGGPHLTPHIRVQQELQAGESREVQAGLAAGRYRIRAQGVPGTAVLDIDTAAASGSVADVEVRVDPAGVTVEPHTVRAQSVRFRFRNETLELTPVMVETSAWLDTAATAATVTSLMEFRDLFSSELLAPGQGIAVGQVTLMFTDLKGSTRMYEQIGDVKAFTLVRDHFKLLEECIRDADGGIVKTIGDAVMAVFDSPRRALAAAVRIQEKARDLKPVDDHATIIKIGIHAGPCIAVQLNEKIDYFGNMVNVAARAQNESVGWDIVLTQAVLLDPDAASLAANIPSEPFVTELKGIAGPVTLKRLWPVGKPKG
jgi:class 3 adenylate cyclase